MTYRLTESYQRLFGLIGLLVVSILIVVGLALYYIFDSWSERANFGDMFGVANTLFSGLAFAAFVIALFMQRQELQLQREELQATREELARSATAQERSEKALKEQLDELVRQRQLSIMPAFTYDPRSYLDGGQLLHNIGNGTALNITMQILEWFSGEHVSVRFLPIDYVPKDGSAFVRTEQGVLMDDGKASSLPEKQDKEDLLPYSSFRLQIQFHDVEGALYEQELIIKSGRCVPLSVKRG